VPAAIYTSVPRPAAAHRQSGRRPGGREFHRAR